MPDDASPFTPEQAQELRDAQERTGSFMGAAKVAAFNGWTIAACAAVTLVFGIFSLTGFLVGVGLAVVARNELTGRKRLRALEVRGLELLWRNQVGLMGLISVYCLWSMYRTVTAPDPTMVELTEVLGEGSGDLVESLTLFVYAGVIVATGIFQGLNARYYFVRIPLLREYLRDTPPWVVDVQRAAAGQ